MNLSEVLEYFGPIDIYLFDQLAKGRFHPERPLLDAGCGAGRNLHAFLRSGFNVHGVDVSPEAVELTRRLAADLAPGLPPENFQASRIESLPFQSGFFGSVISNAVLHFAPDEAAFESMLREMWRVLAPHGLLFVRMTSMTGIEDRIEPLGRGRYHLPDGSDRYLVSEESLLEWTRTLGGRLVDPIKTLNVQGRRCMATWVLHKPD